MTRKNIIKSIFAVSAVILIFIIIALFNNKSSNAFPVSKTGFYFDTIIEISIYDAYDPQLVNSYLDECFSLCQKYENMFSRTNENSDIYRINHSDSNECTVDPEVITLLNYAIDIAKLSDGIVDPTIAPLSDLWNVSDENFSIPSDESIIEALSHVNFLSIKINESKNSVTLTDKDASIDLGFIAKGYIADRIKDYLISQNVNSAVINLGGNVLTIGNKLPDNVPFKIGIKDPKNPDSGVCLKSIDSSGTSVVSSGNYERYKDIDGIRYHHIISTKTGYPVDTIDSDNTSGLSQVTILSDSSLEGDMLSTLCFILGYDKSIDFLQKYYPNNNAIFVTKDGIIIE